MAVGERILAARGLRPAALVLKHGRVVNVFTGEVEAADVAIHDGYIVGIGDYAGAREIDLDGAHVLPGLIDGHMHVESTMLAPGELARALVPRGVTGVVVDPHELANVLGVEGIRLLLAASAGLPLDVFVTLPSCVPASPMETAAFALEAADLAPLLGDPRVVGIAELMNFPGVLDADPALLAKIALGSDAGLAVDGHAPGVRGRDLAGYLTAGVESDHETTDPDEAEERLRRGMWLMVREGSTARNLAALLPVVQRLGTRRALLVTDDRTPTDLRDEGHLDHVVRAAMQLGLDPVAAVTMVALNAAERFGLKRRGAVAPGYHADLVVSDSLTNLRARLVLKGGAVVARDGLPLFESPAFADAAARDSVRIAALDAATFRVPAGDGPCRVIGLEPGQIVTRGLVEHPTRREGEIVADPARDLLKLAVIERHRATGAIGLGLVKGFGLRVGALASSVAHDAHNLIVVGASDADMRRAAEVIAAYGGGLVVIADGEVMEMLPLPIAGLMSDLPYEEVARGLERVEAAAARLGCTVDHPFMALSFLALSVIPSLKLTDRGLLDVDAWRLVPLQI